MARPTPMGKYMCVWKTVGSKNCYLIFPCSCSLTFLMSHIKKVWWAFLIKQSLRIHWLCSCSVRNVVSRILQLYTLHIRMSGCSWQNLSICDNFFSHRITTKWTSFSMTTCHKSRCQVPNLLSNVLAFCLPIYCRKLQPNVLVSKSKFERKPQLLLQIC